MSDAFLLNGLLNDPADPVFWIAVLVVLIGCIMRGFAGFGSAMLFSPIFAVLTTPAHMVALVVTLELPIGLFLFVETRRQADWGLVVPMAIAAVVAMPLGIWLLVSVDQRSLTVAISLLILVFVAILVTGWRYRGPRPMPLTLGIGAASGTMMATSSVGGPPILLYMLAADHPAATIRANVIAYFFVTLFVLMAMVFAAAPTALGALIDGLALYPPMILGVWIGSRLAGRANDQFYRMICYGFIVAAATIGLVG